MLPVRALMVLLVTTPTVVGVHLSFGLPVSIGPRMIENGGGTAVWSTWDEALGE